MPGSDLSVVHRSCVLCEAHCGISVEVDRAANRVSSIKGDPDDPFSRGYICPKAVGMGALATDPDRVVHPLRRVGGDFEEIGWDEAMDLVVERFQHIQATHGKNALATYLGNPNAHDFASNLAVPSLIRGLGTRWRFSASSVDQWPKMFSSGLLYGSVGALPVPDVDHTDYMLMLGANPLASNGSIMTAPDIRGRLRRLRERGGRSARAATPSSSSRSCTCCSTRTSSISATWPTARTEWRTYGPWRASSRRRPWPTPPASPRATYGLWPGSSPPRTAPCAMAASAPAPRSSARSRAGWWTSSTC
jgi:anaerobic selenocysteine-containing dehydrogenase